MDVGLNPRGVQAKLSPSNHFALLQLHHQRIVEGFDCIFTIFMSEFYQCAGIRDRITRMMS